MKKFYVCVLVVLLMACIPALADSTLCAGGASQGGFGGNTFTTVTATSGSCGTAIEMYIPSSADYAKLMWTSSTASSYSSSLGLGNFGGATASVSFTTGTDEPYYMVAFSTNVNLGQSSSTDQILLIEFQNSTLTGTGGDTLSLDPETTLFNLYDNTTGGYLLGGQSDVHTLDDWLALYPGLASDDVSGLWIAEGLSNGAGAAETLTVNYVDVSQTPEPTSLLLLGSGLGVLAGMYRKSRQTKALN